MANNRLGRLVVLSPIGSTTASKRQVRLSSRTSVRLESLTFSYRIARRDLPPRAVCLTGRKTSASRPVKAVAPWGNV
jgi:hypothetical protein